LNLAIPQQNEITRAFFKKKLNVKPLKSKYMVFENNFIWQVDLMTVPENHSGLRYILVCVDVSTRLCDAEAMPDKLAVMCMDAFDRILRRKLIAEEPPKILVTDAGAEFTGQFHQWINRLGIKHRTTQPGRKNQTAIVEYINSLISYALNINAYRLMTTPKGSQNKNYSQIDYFGDEILANTITRINNFMRVHYPKPAKKWFNFNLDIPDTDLRVGDEVFVVNVASDRIRYKYGQHRYLQTPFLITKIFEPTLKGEPYRFMTSLSPKLTFKRDEIIKANDYENNSNQLQFG